MICDVILCCSDFILSFLLVKYIFPNMGKNIVIYNWMQITKKIVYFHTWAITWIFGLESSILLTCPFREYPFSMLVTRYWDPSPSIEIHIILVIGLTSNKLPFVPWWEHQFFSWAKTIIFSKRGNQLKNPWKIMIMTIHLCRIWRIVQGKVVLP
jgi:hypothetical protein